MEFCSKFGYDYGFNGSDEECIFDEEELTKKKITKKSIAKGEWYLKETELRKNKDKERRA